MKLNKLLVAPAALLMALSAMNLTGLSAMSANADNYNQNGNDPISRSSSSSKGGSVTVKGGKTVKSGKPSKSHRSPSSTKGRKGHKSHKNHSHKDSSGSSLDASLADTPKSTHINGFGADTTGGTSNAKHPKIVHSVSALRSALRQANGKPTTIVVKGTLNGNVDPHDKYLSTSNYDADTGYTPSKYRKAYNPKTYGKKEPKGKLENAREKAENNQKKHTEIKLPANVTLAGAPHAKLRNLNLILSNGNDIVRNLNIQAPSDDFPQWDPKDGASGNWNSQYDAISVKGGHDYWIDHNTLTDGKHSDHMPSKATFDRQYQHHDGLTDITDGANDVTVSNNKYMNHDKTMLIGNSDSKTSDKGKLNTSIKHNYFHNTVQRNPRVRYGHVNILNNYYSSNNSNPYPYSYEWGYGKDSVLYGNHDRVVTRAPEAAKHFIAGSAGKSITAHNIIIGGKTYNISGTGDHVQMTLARKKGTAPKIHSMRFDGAKLTFGKHYRNKPSKYGKVVHSDDSASGNSKSGRHSHKDDSSNSNSNQTSDDDNGDHKSQSYSTGNGHNNNSNSGDDDSHNRHQQYMTMGKNHKIGNHNHIKQYMNLGGHHEIGSHNHIKQYMDL